MLAARAVWVDEEIADDIAKNAMQILAETSKLNLRFFCGKKPKCILGGLFYILGFRFKAVKTQKEIALFLCTTEVSVAKSYRIWLEKFPQYFTDISSGKQSINQIGLTLALPRKAALFVDKKRI
jgi:transcription initiation factor TFIIIB Brf1 subunit/transcription initiation factor TFIIB